MAAEDQLDQSEDALPLHRFLTYRLSRVQAKLNAQANTILQRHSGLNLSQWRILALIGVAGQTRLSDLAAAAALDKGMVSRNLKVMVAEGLIAAKTDDVDHRVHRLSLTAEGRALFERTLPKMRQRQDKLRAPLLPQEINALYTALDKLEIAAEWLGEDE